MGTHPIFESDFDCLTECPPETLRLATQPQPSTAKLWLMASSKMSALINSRANMLSSSFTHLTSLSSAQLKKINCEVIAASTDSVFSHLAWTNTDRKQGGLGEMKIPILADTNHAASKAYGCLKEDEGIAFRGLYIIDGKGVLRQITINDLPVGRSVEETLRLVQAFQFVDEHGEVCPAGWKPGKDTMKADPKGSKEYFSKQ